MEKKDTFRKYYYELNHIYKFYLSDWKKALIYKVLFYCCKA